MAELRVDLTRQHIRRAYDAQAKGRQRWQCCPVWQALTGAGMKVHRTYTNRSLIWTPDRTALRSVDHPPEVADWIDAFDQGSAPEPFSFTLEVPDE